MGYFLYAHPKVSKLRTRGQFITVAKCVFLFILKFEQDKVSIRKVDTRSTPAVKHSDSGR